MKAISRRIPFRLTPFSILGLLIAAVGCGTIAIDIRTEIISQQEIRQELEYTISGPMAAFFITDGEIDFGEGTDLADLEALETSGWDVKMEVVQVDGEDALSMRVSQTFKGEDAAEQFKLASAALSEEDTATSMVPFLNITETESEVIYELRMEIEVDDEAPSQPVIEPDPELDDKVDAAFDGVDAEIIGLEDFTDALESSFEDFISVKWTVEMPGHIRESNATDEDGSVLTWNLGFSELSDGGELFARSSVSKNPGGSCNL